MTTSGPTTAVMDLTELASRAGETLGTSSWRRITQDEVDTFAELTGDRQWIHIDAARAEREMPGGRTLAHGYLTLSLLPRLADGW